MSKPTIRIQKTDIHTKAERRQAKLADIEKSRAKGGLTQGDKLDIVIKQNDIIIELLTK